MAVADAADGAGYAEADAYAAAGAPRASTRSFWDARAHECHAAAASGPAGTFLLMHLHKSQLEGYLPCTGSTLAMNEGFLVIFSVLSPCSFNRTGQSSHCQQHQSLLCITSLQGPDAWGKWLYNDTPVVCRARDPYQERSCNGWLRRG